MESNNRRFAVSHAEGDAVAALLSAPVRDQAPIRLHLEASKTPLAAHLIGLETEAGRLLVTLEEVADDRLGLGDPLRADIEHQGLWLDFQSRVCALGGGHGPCRLQLPAAITYLQRRSSRRWALAPGQMTAELKDAYGRRWEGLVEDLSAEGFCLVVDPPPPRDAVLACRLHLPGRPLDCRVEVRYLANGGADCRLGARLVDLTAPQESRIGRFLVGVERGRLRVEG